MTPVQLALLCFALLCLCLIPVTPKTSESSPSVNRPWAPALYDALQARDSVVFTLKRLERRVTVIKMRRVMRSLDNLVSKIDGLNSLDTSKIEGDITLMGKLISFNTQAIGYKLFRSDYLVKDYQREMGKMLKAFQGHHNFRCLQALWSSPKSLQGFDFPIKYMCFQVKRKLLRPQSLSFSTDKICHNVKQCSAGGDSGPEKTHPYDENISKVMTNVHDACQDDNKCDVKKAVSMMGGLLWYKTNKFIARSLCQNYLKEEHPQNTEVYDQNSLTAELNGIKEMTRLLMAYASTLNWDLFFREAIQRRAFSNLEVALGLIEEYEKSFSSSPVACYELQADDVCIYGNINIEYQSIRKTQNNRLNPGKTRNLRLFQRTNHAKMVELKQRSLDYIQILGNIKSVDQNLGKFASDIRNYLVKLAEYDQGIAEEDVTFLQGKLDEFDTVSSKIMERFKKGLTDVFTAATVITTIRLAEDGAVLAAQIVEHLYPPKVMFGGVAIGDMLEQAGKIADTTADLTIVGRMLDTLNDSFGNSYELAKKLNNNAGQIQNLQKLVDSIKKNVMDQIGADGDKFVEAYGSYTPRIDSSDLARNDALWGAFKETACEVLYAADGVLGSAATAVISGMLMCESLEGTLAEYFALRENIFDFQFDLVDSIARVVRGNVAKKLAESIRKPNAPLKTSQLLLGYFMTQNRLQWSASLYCDKLEYLNQGEKVPICSPRIGVFLRRNLDDLIAYKPDTTYHLDERFVYIPTRAQFNGDTGFINWQALKSGETVNFRLPANLTWLRQFNWLSKNDKNVAPFVQSFKLYLPRKTYDASDSPTYSKTRIRLTSIASSAVGNGDVSYNLPLEHSQYLTAYSEGFNPSRCPSGGNIANPYSLCDNLPNICDTTTRVVGTSLMPTILSTWKLAYLMETSTTQPLSWDAPDPATNMLVTAKVKLRFPSFQNSKRSKLPSMDTAAKPGCCTGNKYRPNWYENTCIPCPVKPAISKDSKMNLGGYYCEKGQE